MKKILICILAILVLVLTSCDEKTLKYYDSAFNFDTGNMQVKIKDGFSLNPGHSYDIVETECGYDIVFHFVEEKK